jgi:cold shock CspA family protein
MLWFNLAKDHGFIRTEEDERLAVAGDGFAPGEKPEGRCAQKAVTFQIETNEGERQARNVVFDKEVAARRARLRGGGRSRG